MSFLKDFLASLTWRSESNDATTSNIETTSASRKSGLIAYSFKASLAEYKRWEEYNETWTTCHANEFIQSTDVHSRSKNITGFYYDGLRSSDTERDEILAHLQKMGGLKWLMLENARLDDFPDSVCSLTALTYLNLRRNSLTKLPDKLCELNSLTHLDLSENSLKLLPDSIGKLENLEDLQLWINKSLTHLTPSILQLTKLVKLDCDYCNALIEPPLAVCHDGVQSVKAYFEELIKTGTVSDSLSVRRSPVAYTLRPQPAEYQHYWSDHNEGWVKFHADEFIQSIDEKLLKNITGFYYDGELSDDDERDKILSYLQHMKSVERLTVWRARLTTIPDSVCSLTTLTYLNLYDNSITSVPDMLCKLTKLKYLDLEDNFLTSLPDSVCSMTTLTGLCLTSNFLASLPDSIGKLRNLEELWLWENKSLQHLPPTIIQLNKLRKLDCTECEALVEPPPSVCHDGVHAVKVYFEELIRTGAARAFTTVALLGPAMAGKTSIVRTLQAGERRFTERTAEHDEATKVVSVENVDVKSREVVFLDFGGAEIYHHTYSLSIKEKGVTVFVVDLHAIHEEIIQNKEVKAIVKKQLFDWLSNAYTTAPNLGSSALVLTHTDLLSREEVRASRDLVLKALDELKITFLEEQEIFFEEQEASGTSDSLFKRIAHITTDSPLFGDGMIFEVGADMSGFAELTDFLVYEINDRLIKVPKSWKDLGNAILKELPSYIKYDDLFKKLAEICPGLTTLDEALHYLHSTGIITWFSQNPHLRGIIFHRLDEISKFLQGIFDHEEIGWSTKSEYFKASRYFPDVESLQRSVQVLKDTGLMSESLLLHSIRQLSASINLPPKIGIDLLVQFKLAYGPFSSPADGENCFYMPALCKNPSVLLADDQVSLEARIKFKGLPLPEHVYHKLLVCVLQQFTKLPTDHWKFHKSGVYVRMDKFIIQLDHNSQERRFDMRVISDGKQISLCWLQLMTSARTSLLCVKADWPGVLYEVRTSCGHCLSIGGSVEEVCYHYWTKITADDVMKFTRDGKVHLPQRESPSELPKTCICRGQVIPYLLKYPPVSDGCTEDQVKFCVDYIAETRASRIGASPNTSYTGSVQTPHTASGSALTYTTAWPTMAPHLVRRFDQPSPDIYKMTTPIRGRCLIINNRFYGQPNERIGSESDVTVMHRLFEDLKFNVEVIEDCKDLVTAIRAETRRDEHKDYGTFALIIMSHGGKADHTESTYIVNADGSKVSTAELWPLLDSKNFVQMAGKPKLVLIQACSGYDVSADTQSEAAVEMSIPHSYTCQDMLLATANYPGTKLGTPGSIFINAVAQVFSEQACDEHIQDILTMVNQRVGMHEYQLRSGKLTEQTVWMTSTLTKKFYLFPGLE